MRVDTGVYEGGEISMFYDSMIAKLIVHAATRDQAIARMHVKGAEAAQVAVEMANLIRAL